MSFELGRNLERRALMLAKIKQKKAVTEHQLRRIIMDMGYSYSGANEKVRELKMGQYIVPKGNKWVVKE